MLVVGDIDGMFVGIADGLKDGEALGSTLGISVVQHTGAQVVCISMQETFSFALA